MGKKSSILVGAIIGAGLGFAVGYFIAGIYGGQRLVGPYGLSAAVWGGIALGVLVSAAVAMFAAEVFPDR
jgi:hypothetical protein